MWIVPARLRRIVRGYALSIAFWLAAAILVSYQTYDQDRRIHLPAVFTNLLLVYAIRYLTIAFLTPPIFYLVGRWPVTGAAVRRCAGYALGYVPFSLAFAAIRWLLLPPWIEDTLSWGQRTVQTLLYFTYNTFADTLLLYIGIVVAAHAYTYFVRGQRQEIDRLELLQALSQSELQALRAQLRPHFLFNTLQGVSTLIDTDRVAAQTMLVTLATLLRTSLKHGSADLVSLREELDFVDSYLNLEKMRLGRRLQVRRQIDPRVYGALIPQLLLQPLIENAVVHGIANSREGGWIEVQAYVRDDRLHVAIRNTIGGESQPGLGVGIANTRARLKFLYSDDASFEFQLQRDTGVALALLALPAFIAPAAEKAPTDSFPAELRT